MVYRTRELAGATTVCTGMLSLSVCLFVTTTGLLIFLGIGGRMVHCKDHHGLYTQKNEAKELICFISEP